MSRSSSNSCSARNPIPGSSRIRILNDNAPTTDREGPIPSSLSLLSARRPSWAPTPLYDHNHNHNQDPVASFRDVPTFGSALHQNMQPSSASPDDGGNFRRSLQIDMKDLVGDAVGNMSISPASRDIVLAARRGLFIIDLEAPFEVPRFLPQGGTWDVADVQWNPHRVRAEYIVSTSSEKLLIWNLMIVGKTSIEHILHSHYRAITDINWHNSEPDTVCSTGIDSWLWSWDLREPRKPVLGLCAFNAGGTQVKWNRQDPHVLASSHMNEVLVWDRRKGSLPTARIEAHNAKIYGIDWAHSRANDIVTCSLDKTIKVWNVQATPSDSGSYEPTTTICTRYPVWRARDLPFGHGLLSLPQRGETTLEMWANGNSRTPVEVFEGHTDVVKEFVWRKGGFEGGEYQLITWSKDRTLRFWPVDSETMEKTGHAAASTNKGLSRFFTEITRNQHSFRRPPEGSDAIPALSAPIGSRGILAEVRAPLPPRKYNPVLQPHHGSAARAKSHERGLLLNDSTNHPPVSLPIPVTIRQGGTMSRGNIGGKSARVDPFAWLANVKVGGRRSSSSGPGSGADSGDVSRLSSRSRPSAGRDRDLSVAPGQRRRSESRVRDDRREGEGTQSLQDEITSVLTRLATSKVRLEKHDLTKRRTCTLGLHGPWGESSSVFIRVSFRFPKSYPHGLHPEGTPDIEMERNPLISMQNRAFMLRRLRGIRERRRPCLEACLRFLLFGDEDEEVGVPVSLDSDSSSEDAEPLSRKSRDFTMLLLRNNKNLAEPRTSQGVFGPSGELVCFFRAPPRIVRNVPREISASPAAPPQSPSTSRFFQSPALLSDAVRRLGLAATDRKTELVDPRHAEDGDNTLRIMTNLLTFSQQKARRGSGGESLDSLPTNYALLPTRRSTVFITIPTDVASARQKVAAEYVLESQSLVELCETNARIARENRQFNHERVFKTLQALFPSTSKSCSPARALAYNPITNHIVTALYQEFCASKDVQMLAMMAIVLLKVSLSPSAKCDHTPDAKGPSSASSKTGGDYFSLTRRKDSRAGALSPGWPRLPSTSPTTPAYAAGASLSSSNSSRGSWSSLFNTGSVRQFMSGVQESIATPLDGASGAAPSIRIPVPVSMGERVTGPDSPRRKGFGRNGSANSASAVSKSWSETPVIALPKQAEGLPTAGHGRRPTFSQVISPRQVIQEKKKSVVFEEEFSEKTQGQAARPGILDSHLLNQFACHVLAYAEMLFKWQLLNKRLELLNAVKISTFLAPDSRSTQEVSFDVLHKCVKCGRDLARDAESCTYCVMRSLNPRCSVCRLPIKGLSRSCPQCLHVTHISCWRSSKFDFCATGCGCRCSGHVLNSLGGKPLAPSPVLAPSLLSKV
ncbi:hypothetical protein BV22DRAFT_1094123 [Leucogyrophana mollusca]|uniref:Uncharacterized protein n=1 Tax=Leucogyrophana mollusca TaxID=85980 RepID=A0ACB8BD24_9AGAM|nr:hypothetical protein BV22DRAFT_1094123 [Leucogyrophana mollusca]